MLMLESGLEDARADEILSAVENAIGQGGSLVGRHDWGNRRMTFEIAHHPEAHYHLFQFNATPELLESLARTLRLTDGVLRFRIIRLAPGTPDPPHVAAQAPARAESPPEPTAAESAPPEPEPQPEPQEA
jgi:small subunit ribosomal protein S6